MRADRLVELALRSCDFRYVIALGKAADALAAGAARALGRRLQAGFVAQARGYATGQALLDHRFACHEGGHPLPDDGSLAAGAALERFVGAIAMDEPVAVLVSGGASACVEIPALGVSLSLLTRANRWLLASGLSITDMNRVRGGLSRLKSGGLAQLLGARTVEAWILCDVPGGELESVGGGPLRPLDGRLPQVPAWLAPHLIPALSAGPVIPLHRLAGNEELVQAVVAAGARSAGALHGEAEPLGGKLANRLMRGAPGLSAWGGEARVRLAGHPGRGGRCQALALAAASALAGRSDCFLLAGASDGWDGTDPVAGACVDGETLARGQAASLEARHCLEAADSGRFLEASGDLIRTGATGTNVNDIVIGLKIET